MAEMEKLARPIMGRSARFHTDEAGVQLCKEGKDLGAAQRLSDYDLPRFINGVNLKDVFGQIEADGANGAVNLTCTWLISVS